MARPEGEIINLVMHGNTVEVPYFRNARTLLVVGGDESNEMVGLVRRAADQRHESLNVFIAKNLAEAYGYASVMDVVDPTRLAVFLDGEYIQTSGLGTTVDVHRQVNGPLLEYFTLGVQFFASGTDRPFGVTIVPRTSREASMAVISHLFPQPASAGHRARRMAG